jgi:hypothetical protein
MKKFISVVMLCAVLCSLAYAADIVPPAWRTNPIGSASTTYQRWDFTTGANPAVATEVHNAFGNPVLTLDTGTWLQTYNTASGVWRVLFTGGVNMTIPNTGDNSPNSWKEIWLQITYRDPGGDGLSDVPIVTDPLYESLALVSRQALSNGYFHDVYSIILRPNPTQEDINLFSIQYAIYIDGITVETYCVPEPATIGLLTLGGLLLRRKK